MKQSQLIEALAQSTDLPKADVHRVLKALTAVIEASVAAGEDVGLPGIGRFTTKWRQPRVLRRIDDGRKLRIEGRFVPQFRAAAGLKRIAEGRTEQHWRDPEHQKAWRKAEVLIGDLALYHADEAPTLNPGDDDAAVRRICEQTFGDSWRRANATYERDVSAEVRSTRDYLAGAAAARWSP